MLLGKGSQCAWAWFHFNNKVECPPVESLGTALASTTLQAKPAWSKGKAKQVPQCTWGKKEKKKRSKSITLVQSTDY